MSNRDKAAGPLPEDPFSASPKEPASAVKSLDRAVAILTSFSMERPELAMSEISRLTGLTTSTTHRLLSALEVHGLVRRAGARRFALGPGVRRLAKAASAQFDLQEAARPVMRWMRDGGGETVGLHLLDTGTNLRVVIDQVESHEPLRRTYTLLGERIPLNQGAPGKVILAYLPTEVREAVLSMPLHAATEHTITDPEVLARDIDATRKRGYAISFEERVVGIRTVAAPIRDHTGAVIGSVSITGPALRLSRRRLGELGTLVVRGGVEISMRIGFEDVADDRSSRDEGASPP